MLRSGIIMEGMKAYLIVLAVLCSRPLSAAAAGPSGGSSSDTPRLYGVRTFIKAVLDEASPASYSSLDAFAEVVLVGEPNRLA